jgi:hypothetical protein
MFVVTLHPDTNTVDALAMQVLYERKIIGRVYGSEKEQFQAAFGYELLKSTVEKLGADHPYTVLVPDMRGVDPDDWTSPVPYEKGYYFLRYLEDLVGAEVHPKHRASPYWQMIMDVLVPTTTEPRGLSATSQGVTFPLRWYLYVLWF